MVRGNNGQKIFAAEFHKREYITRLSKYKEQFFFKLFAYCIMDNHAHLLIQVNNTPLSEIMQRIQQVYTQWFNRRYGRTGHVFQQRYKALLCNKENYLLQLIKYIHYNPAKANICKGINYKWSSHSNYIGVINDGVADTDEILRMFSENRKQAVKEYLQFMEQKSEEISLRDFRESEPEEKIPSQSGRGIQFGRISIDEVIEKVCFQEKVSINEIIRKTRIQKVSDIRKAIVLLSERHCDVTNTLLAQKLNLPLSMISKIKSGVSKRTDYVQEIIHRFQERISE
ncbi:transposase [Metallumcola ferriviriculae]|uniref:Transposase n=1 Tax=Metallumcola ferriviriculae TaxID=3039180 RepID=A0AAU0US69_9FIRM|nr:transposase [Desulfitibacteraceae bacterium MK1]